MQKGALRISTQQLACDLTNHHVEIHGKTGVVTTKSEWMNKTKLRELFQYKFFLEIH